MDDLMRKRAQDLASGVSAALKDNAIQGPHYVTLTALLNDFDNSSVDAMDMLAPPLPTILYLMRHDDEELRS